MKNILTRRFSELLVFETFDFHPSALYGARNRAPIKTAKPPAEALEIEFCWYSLGTRNFQIARVLKKGNRFRVNSVFTAIPWTANDQTEATARLNGWVQFASGGLATWIGSMSGANRVSRERETLNNGRISRSLSKQNLITQLQSMAIWIEALFSPILNDFLSCFHLPSSATGLSFSALNNFLRIIIKIIIIWLSFSHFSIWLDHRRCDWGVGVNKLLSRPMSDWPIRQSCQWRYYIRVNNWKRLHVKMSNFTVHRYEQRW